MAKERHLLTEIDPDLRIGFCSACNTLVKIVTNGVFKTNGDPYWRCARAHRATTNATTRPWTQYKKTYCEECNFLALHPAQLHVDHINGSKEDNSPENLQTLCANCHAYKTAMNQDWHSKKFSQSSTS